jgi:5-methylcytosine-specific restriction endonuclease McrA
MKAYWAKNKEAKKVNAIRYRAKNREALAEKARTYYDENKEVLTETRKIYYSTHKGAFKKSQKIYYNTHKEAVKELCRAWRIKNRDKVNAKSSIRRARLKNVNDIKTSEDRKLLATMYKTALSYEVKTGFAWHIDHTIPITKGGRHCLTNLQIVPARWNQSKGNRHKRKFVYATKEKEHGYRNCK